MIDLVRGSRTGMDEWVRLWMHRAVAQLYTHVHGLGGESALRRFPFLEAWLESCGAGIAAVLLEAPTHLRREMLRAEAMLPEEAAGWPIERVRRGGFEEAHVLALILAGLVEEDARFSTLYAAIQPSGDERLSVGLLTDVLASLPAASQGWPIVRDLLKAGFLTCGDDERPRASRSLSVPAPVWDALRGDLVLEPAPSMRYVSPDDFPALADLSAVLEPETYERVARLPALLRDGLAGGVIVRGMAGSGRLDVAGSVASELSLGVIVLEASDGASLAAQAGLLGPLCTLYGAIPVVRIELLSTEVIAAPELTGFGGPQAFILGREGSIEGGVTATCALVNLPSASPRLRRRLWQEGLPEGTSRELIESVSSRFRVTPGAVKRAAGLATAYAALNGRFSPGTEDVREGLRSVNRESLDSLAARVEGAGSADDLVVGDTTRQALSDFIARGRQREDVIANLGRGFGTSASRGVRALFSGPSGTGKTLAASVAANALGLDLYRLDLASVVNKYVGETERNLSRVFARAEELDVVLLIDEGDSLMTGRTDVHTSNDRYANLETNYLLQRLESYEGILIVTTNAANRIDKAFSRRIDVQVEFTAPDASQRYEIWQLHLPHRHSVQEWFLRTVSTRCQLSGGQIRSAALLATVLALEDGRGVEDRHVAEAVSREYRKTGTASPLGTEALQR